MALRSPAPFGCAAWRAGPGRFASARYQLPIRLMPSGSPGRMLWLWLQTSKVQSTRSEEHTSELQSRGHLVCRLLLEKKKKDSNRDETTVILLSICAHVG